MSAAAVFFAAVRFSGRFAAFSTCIMFHSPSLAGFCGRSSRQLFVVITDWEFSDNFARLINLPDSRLMRVRSREVPRHASQLLDALTAVIRVYGRVNIFRLASLWRIFRICAVDSHARHLTLLLNRTNLFEDIFHLVVRLKSNGELPRSAIEGDLDLRPARPFRCIHGLYDGG